MIVGASPPPPSVPCFFPVWWHCPRRSLVMLLFYCMLAAPGYLLNFPIVAIAKFVAIRQARIALAGSTVKVAGRDVMASYKV